MEFSKKLEKPQNFHSKYWNFSFEIILFYWFFLNFAGSDSPYMHFSGWPRFPFEKYSRGRYCPGMGYQDCVISCRCAAGPFILVHFAYVQEKCPERTRGCTIPEKGSSPLHTIQRHWQALTQELLSPGSQFDRPYICLTQNAGITVTRA